MKQYKQTKLLKLRHKDRILKNYYIISCLIMTINVNLGNVNISYNSNKRYYIIKYLVKILKIKIYNILQNRWIYDSVKNI